MTSLALPAVHITPEEYLELDRAATDAKHEYFDGEIVPYEQKTIQQCRIATNLMVQLSGQVEDVGFLVLGSSLRVGTAEPGLLDTDTVPQTVIPAQAGIQSDIGDGMDSRLRGNDVEVGKTSCPVNLHGHRYNGHFFAYPGVSVCPTSPRLLDAHEDVLLDPLILADVTQPSRSSSRFEHYRTIPTLQDYLVVAQDVMHVVHHQRQAEGRWLLTDFRAPDDIIELTGVAARLSLTDLYDRITFDA